MLSRWLLAALCGRLRILAEMLLHLGPASPCKGVAFVPLAAAAVTLQLMLSLRLGTGSGAPAGVFG